MVIKIDGDRNIAGWIHNRSQHNDDADSFAIHVRVFKGSRSLDGYDSPIDEGYATFDEAEEMLLKKCYEVALNALQVSRIPF